MISWITESNVEQSTVAKKLPTNLINVPKLHLKRIIAKLDEKSLKKSEFVISFLKKQ